LGKRAPHLFTRTSREARVAGRTLSREDETALVREIIDTIGLETGTPTCVLGRLDALPCDVSEAHRKQLLEAARAAVEVAYDYYEYARSFGREKMPNDAAFERMCKIPFADLREFGAYIHEVAATAKDLKESLAGVRFFEVAEFQSKIAEDSTRKAFEWIERGGAAVEVTEIRWAVERKCMYWAAVALMKARIDVGLGGGISASQAARMADEAKAEAKTKMLDKTSMTDRTSPKYKAKMADRRTVAETTSTEGSEMLPKVYQRPIDEV
jgi:hypothetical protein